jgi:hypothetical protein
LEPRKEPWSKERWLEWEAMHREERKGWMKDVGDQELFLYMRLMGY